MNIPNVIREGKELALQATAALAKADIHVTERHNVIVPGTLTTVEESTSLLRQSIKDCSEITLYTGFVACPYICHFCRYRNVGFNSQNSALIVDGLSQEILLRNQLTLPRHSVSSLYIGGGTPTMFSMEQHQRVLTEARAYHSFAKNIEITMETTPEVVTRNKMIGFQKLGVNRWSMGIQWLNNAWLKSMGRKHSIQDVLNALEVFRGLGTNFNIDLMYGFEGQTAEDLVRDILIILQYMPNQITLYRLETEKRTDDGAIKADRMESISVYALQAAGRIILQEHGYRESPDGWFTAPWANPAAVYEDRWNRQIPMVAYGAEAYSFSALQQFTNVSFRPWLSMTKEGRLPIDATRTFKYDETQAARRAMTFRLRSAFSSPILSDRPFFERLQTAGLGTLKADQFELNGLGIMTVQEIIRKLIS